MEIKAIQTSNLDYTVKTTPVNKKIELKNCDYNANNITGNYNIAFCGLFKKKKPEIIIHSTILWSQIPLDPNEKYRVTDNAQFMLGDYYLDLGSREINPIIKDLKKNESIIFGRDETNPNHEMSDNVSREHLKLTKEANGTLIAQDLNSTNGTILLPTHEKFKNSKQPYKLIPGRKYLMPYNSVISVVGNSFILENFRNDFENKKDGDSIVIGRNPNCDVTINNKAVSDYHCKITKYGSKLLVEDLHSTNGTYFNSKLNAFDIDLSYINEIKKLNPNRKIKVPNDCQIYLGNDLVIDLRNKNILNLFNSRDIITVGRNQSSDIIVPQFYNQVSKNHLTIEKDDNDLIVTDLGSTNGTKIIPKNCIKPFYGDLSDLNFSQGNIGDCYLLASLYAICKSPLGRKYITRMVNIDDKGNYKVKFHNKPEITVKLEELDGQTNKDGKVKVSVAGDLGIKAIERAYAKMLKAEDQARFFSFKDTGTGTLFQRIDSGGYISDAIRYITGLETDYQYVPNSNIDFIFKDIVHKGMDNMVIACSTPKRGRYNGYVDPNKLLCENHAFSIKNIDPYYKTVSIVDPHNTKEVIETSWDDFKKYFDFIYIASI